jgi:hypothetical protein
MSMEITEVHYDPQPKHIIIRSDQSRVSCSNPVPATEWLDGTLGETLCLDDRQYMDFEKALCDGIWFNESIFIHMARYVDCLVCGIPNQQDCCINTNTVQTFGYNTTIPNDYPIEELRGLPLSGTCGASGTPTIP